jgi:ribosome-binding protein aMBF1 (putative translation factor)
MVRKVRGLIGRGRGAVSPVKDSEAQAIRKRFGQKIRELRLRTGLSQEELAELAFLDRSYIGGVERGERNVSLVNIYKIARALKSKPGDLFS